LSVGQSQFDRYADYGLTRTIRYGVYKTMSRADSAIETHTADNSIDLPCDDKSF